MAELEKMELESRILEFVTARLIADPNIPVSASTPLVSSGLVDSFDLVELLSEVERLAGRRLPTSRIGPQDMESVDKILDLLERF